MDRELDVADGGIEHLGSVRLGELALFARRHEFVTGGQCDRDRSLDLTRPGAGVESAELASRLGDIAGGMAHQLGMQPHGARRGLETDPLKAALP